MTEDIYDTPTGKILLIPQGAQLIGQYDAQAAFGQSRALLVWNRLIMPNGRSIVPERQPGRDPEGHAGLEDQVDNHSGVRAVEVDKPVKVTIDLPADRADGRAVHGDRSRISEDAARRSTDGRQGLALPQEL